MKKLLTTAVLLAASASAAWAQNIADVKVGDRVTVDGKEYLVGANLVTNPHFNTVDNGNITGWKVGSYAQMTTSNFAWNETGGTDGGSWIKASGHTGAGGDNSIGMRWNIETNAKYYFSFWVTGVTTTSQYIVASVTANESTAGGQNETSPDGRIIVGQAGAEAAAEGVAMCNVPTDASQWAQTNLYFDSEDNTYVQFNARWLNSTWGFDNFYLAKLYDAATTTPSQILYLELQSLQERMQSYEETDLSEYPGLASEIEDAVLSTSSSPSSTEAAIQADIDALNATWNTVKQGVIDAGTLNTLVNTASNLQSTTAYPGLGAFQDAVDAADGILNDASGSVSADYAKAVADLTAAMNTYRMSQTATVDQPADYTFLISAPWFCNDANTPASNSLDDIAAAGLSASVQNGTGWIKGSTSTEGDQRLNYTQNRTCWNAWATNFTGTLDIHQNLTGLPNGYYSITCDAITQSGCLNDQHAYVTSSAETVNSPAMTTEGWDNDDVTLGTWEMLNTATTGKVLVSDGKLTIGMMGTHDANKLDGTAADGRNGWFCVTNFKLQYYGAATLEDLQKVYAAKVAECQAQVDTMRFKGDKATYQDAITANSGATTEADINAALDALNAAQDSAALSIYAQNEVLNGSYKAIQDSIAAGVYDATLAPIMQSAVDNATAIIDAEGQTRACRDNTINSLRAYRYDYADEYNKAMAAIKTYNSQASIDCVQSTIDSQIGRLKDSLMSAADVAEFVAQIEKALVDAAANEVMAGGGTDYSSVIVNPTIDGASNDVVPNGWTIAKTDGNTYTNQGQQYDGNTDGTTGRYLDSWNATTGKLLYNAHQTIENLPNGTYVLKAMCRTSGEPGKEGTYLYTIADNDSVNGVKLGVVKREQSNITTNTQSQVVAANGGDSIAYVMDTYGTIWEDAAAATNYGVTGSAENLAIFGTHGNMGYGWHYVEVQAEVKDHTLTIGFTNDSTFTQGYGGDPFTGTWISADNFTLTQITLGDNSDWSPVTGITAVDGDDSKLAIEVVNGKIVTNKPCSVYTINGQQVNAKATLASGIYIVKSGSQAVKVMVK